ncbi:MAG: diguanylate cyclase, partial [Oscillospiraceae bacterium]
KERSGKNFIDVARAMNNGRQVEKYQSDLKKGRSGVSHFIMQEEDRFFAYAPIQDANDWYLMTSLPAAAVFERSQKVILFTVLLLAAVSVLFTLTMLYIAVTKRKANAKIVHMAYYDTLTGAANTERFKLDAQELFRLLGSERYALLNFDVKQFRYLNSDLGYGAGDKLLVHIAHCLEKFSSKNEAFARAGTDQFLFLLTKKGDSKATAQYAEKLQEAIAEWRQPTGGYYSVRTALGIY